VTEGSRSAHPVRAIGQNPVMQERIGVVGSGVMGSGIAQVLARTGHEVWCYDQDPEALERARDSVENGRFGLRNAVTRGKATADDVDAALARLHFTLDRQDALDVDVVIGRYPSGWTSSCASGTRSTRWRRRTRCSRRTPPASRSRRSPP
jgi:glycerol-3-phosphate dehydrogenase